MKTPTMSRTYSEVARKASVPTKILKRGETLPTVPMSPTDKQLIDLIETTPQLWRPIKQEMEDMDTLIGFKDPCFPEIHKNNFNVMDTRQVTPTLTIAYCGVIRGNSQKLWSFCVGTPGCLVEKIYPKENMGTTYSRFILTPDYTNDVHGSDFTTFMDCVEAISEKVRNILEERGEDVTNWNSACRSRNGVLEGLQVKVRMAYTAEEILKMKGSVKAVIKLSCVYFTPEKCGLSWEMVKAVPLNPFIQDTPEPWNKEESKVELMY